jgi:hypothetical protein
LNPLRGGREHGPPSNCTLPLASSAARRLTPSSQLCQGEQVDDEGRWVLSTGGSEAAAGRRILQLAAAHLGWGFADYGVADGKYPTAPFLGVAGALHGKEPRPIASPRVEPLQLPATTK